MVKMKNSGYGERYRVQILNSAFKAYETMVEEDKNGTKPLYRERSWRKEERTNKKRSKKLNWFKNSNQGIQYSSILFVPPTPGGLLAKQLRIREKQLNNTNKERIKIQEKGGTDIENILGKKNPFKKEKCKEKSSM